MRKFGWFLLLALMAAGCTNSEAVGTLTIAPSPTITRTPAPTPTNRITPPAPVTATTRPTATPTPTVTPPATSTPYPTLEKEQAWNTLTEWLEGDPECLLPCWGGIMPGHTSWSEAIQIISPITSASEISDRRFDWQFNHLYTPQDTEPPVFGTVIGDETGQVASLSYSTHTSEMPILLDLILEQYGFPKEVLIETSNYEDPEETFFLDMILTFPMYNFILQYHREAGIEDNKIVACGDPVLSSLHILQGDGRDWDTEQILNIVYGAQETPPNVQEMEAVSDWDIESFYYYYLKYPTGCFSTPLSSWP
jgi:hypothetical protein